MAAWWSRTPPDARPQRRFETLVLPHLDAGYNLARWLLRDDAQADDAVQEAALRALRYFDALRGDDARAWFLGIVRNTCYTALGRPHPEQTGWDEEALEALHEQSAPPAADPASDHEHARERLQVDAALRALAPALREVIVLRDLQGLDYAEIARIAGVPVGTVMSRLSRARARLRLSLAALGPKR
jgi:RNA polymerase sigma-70 factor (ECF subfamily)